MGNTHLARIVGAIMQMSQVVLTGNTDQLTMRKRGGLVRDERGLTSTELAVIIVGVVIIAGVVIAVVTSFVKAKLAAVGG